MSRVPAQIAFFYFDEADHTHRVGGEVEGMQLEPRLFFGGRRCSRPQRS
jgi:hypothetical protein